MNEKTNTTSSFNAKAIETRSAHKKPSAKFHKD